MAERSASRGQKARNKPSVVDRKSLKINKEYKIFANRINEMKAGLTEKEFKKLVTNLHLCERTTGRTGNK